MLDLPRSRSIIAITIGVKNKTIGVKKTCEK